MHGLRIGRLSASVRTSCVIAGIACGAPAVARADGGRSNSISDCSGIANVYDYTQSALARCGISASDAPAVTNFSGGGARYDYTIPGEPGTTIYVPPDNYDWKDASAAKLREYDIEQRPLASAGLQAIMDWQNYVALLKHPEPAPPFLTAATTSAPLLPAGTSSAGTTENWSGWLVNPSSPGTVHTTFGEPSIASPTSKCVGASGSFWSGLGGYNGAALGQAGTAVGSTGLNQNEAWWEYIPAGGTSHMMGLGTTYGAGTQIGALTQYYGGVYSGTVGNDSTASYTPWRSTGSNLQAPGKTAEAIAERTTSGQTLTPLSNFGQMVFSDSFTVPYSGGDETFFDQYATDARDQLTMLSNAGVAITSVSGIGNSGGFTDKWLGC